MALFLNLPTLYILLEAKYIVSVRMEGLLLVTGQILFCSINLDLGLLVLCNSSRPQLISCLVFHGRSHLANLFMLGPNSLAFEAKCECA